MKQQLPWLWLLSVALLLSSVSTAKAQNVRVEDTWISLSESNDNVLAGKGEGRDGCVSYDAKTKTLTLKNAVLKSREQSSRLYINGTHSDTITIRLIGENSMLASFTNTFKIHNSNVRLTGSGSLSVSNGNDDRYVTFSVSGPGSSLIIDSTSLSVIGSLQNASCDAKLVINHSTVKASLTCFKEISLKDCYISEPKGAYIGTGEDEVGTYQAIVTQEGQYVYNYTILPGNLTEYPISVAGTIVSSKNKDNILAGEGLGRDGAVYYDAETKTLTLKNARLTSPSEEKMLVINEFGADTLTINLIGENYLKSNSNTLALRKSIVRITGSGSLESVSTNTQHMGIAPLGEDTHLIISGTTITAKGGAAIFDPNFKASLTIENSRVNAEGGIAAKMITLKDCFIDLPRGGRVGKGSANDGTEVMGVWDTSNNLALSCVILPKSHSFIAPIGSSKVTIQFNPITKDIQLAGLAAGEKAYIINTMGATISELQANADGVVNKSVSQLPTGYYLIVTTEGTYKIAVTQ